LALSTLSLGAERAGGVRGRGGDEGGSSAPVAGDCTVIGGGVASFSTGLGTASVSLASTSFKATTSGPGPIDGEPDPGEGGAEGVGSGLSPRTRASGLPVIEDAREPLLPLLVLGPNELEGFELDELSSFGVGFGALALDAEAAALAFDFGGVRTVRKVGVRDFAGGAMTFLGAVLPGLRFFPVLD
jgi:hypothetical protein